jgi:hypothetical protein
VGVLSTSAAILLLLACLAVGYLAVRRVRLMRGGGVDVCLRRGAGREGWLRLRAAPRDAGAGWHFGVGRYRGDQLAWYRLTSFRIGPTVVVDRTELQIVERRPPAALETYALPQAASILTARSGGADVEIAMTPDVLTGFLAWLEAGPPGRTGYRQAC